MMVRGSIEGYFAIGKEKERKKRKEKRKEQKREEDKARQYTEQKKKGRQVAAIGGIGSPAMIAHQIDAKL